jgi:hypothetical protein
VVKQNFERLDAMKAMIMANIPLSGALLCSDSCSARLTILKKYFGKFDVLEVF